MTSVRKEQSRATKVKYPERKEETHARVIYTVITELNQG